MVLVTVLFLLMVMVFTPFLKALLVQYVNYGEFPTKALPWRRPVFGTFPETRKENGIW